MAGRKPKPAELVELEGNPSKLTQAEIAARRGPAFGELTRGAPDYFGEHALEAWGHLAQPLKDAGLLTEGTAFAFESLCHWMGVRKSIVLAMLKREAEGVTVDGVSVSPNGHRQQDALFGMFNTADKSLRWWIGEFGLTPASAARLGVIDGAVERDALDDFIDEGAESALDFSDAAMRKAGLNT